jgi:GNAT superfamily N-acetyltransferase
MSRNLTIEAVTSENFGTFIDLIRQFAQNVDLAGPDDEAAARLRRDGLSDDPKFQAYLGVHEDATVGYVVFFMTYSSFLALPTLYIEDLFILEKYQRMGFGQQLFDFCIKQAKEHNCGRIEWNVPNEDKPAIKFYRKNKAKNLNRSLYQITL